MVKIWDVKTVSEILLHQIVGLDRGLARGWRIGLAGQCCGWPVATMWLSEWQKHAGMNSLRRIWG
jgi:hypothetical protein